MEVAGTAGTAGGQATTWRVLAHRGPALVEQLEEESQEELFGLGTTDLTTTARSRVNNTQSSTADLRILHQRELELIRALQHNEQACVAVEDGLAEDGFSLENVVLSDVLHPVDSYNLVKRTARTWPKIFTRLPSLEEELQSAVETARSQFPAWQISRVAAGLGLLNIHVYYRQTGALETLCYHVLCHNNTPQDK